MEFEHHAPHDTTPSPPPPSQSKARKLRRKVADGNVAGMRKGWIGKP